MKLKAMTFNVQHFKNYRSEEWFSFDYSAFAEYLAEKKPDIIGFNEVMGRGESPEYSTEQTALVAEMAGFPYSFFGPAALINGTEPYGNALMSYYPFEAEVVKIPLPEGKTAAECEPRAVICAKLNIDGKPLTVLATHFGLSPAEAENAVKTVCELAERLDGPIILMGDFNLTPDSELLKPLEKHYYDTAALLPTGNSFTFPSDAPDRKIDYIYSRDIKVTAARVCDEAISDHRALEIELEF